MTEYRVILRKVGIALIILGVVDIAYMSYCLVNQLSYASSFNILALIAGVFLLNGNLRAAVIVAWFSGFYAAGFLGLFVLLPVIQPMEVWILKFKLNPLINSIFLLSTLLIVAFSFWVYSKLTCPAVLAARAASDLSGTPPKWPFALGGALVVALTAVTWFTFHGTSAEIAISKVRERLGAGYEYNISRISISGDHVFATVTAYNDTEIRNIEIDWKQ